MICMESGEPKMVGGVDGACTTLEGQSHMAIDPPYSVPSCPFERSERSGVGARTRSLG
jgi:hypothetical protein